MSEFLDKVKGVTNEAVGKAKQVIGQHTDNAKLEGEGVAQETEGHLQQAKGSVKGAVKNVVDKA